MSAIPPCLHGMPTPASCVDCMADGPVAPPTRSRDQLLAATRYTTARYDGRCPHRGCDITAGDRIGYSTELDAWVCGRCCA